MDALYEGNFQGAAAAATHVAMLLELSNAKSIDKNFKKDRVACNNVSAWTKIQLGARRSCCNRLSWHAVPKAAELLLSPDGQLDRIGSLEAARDSKAEDAIGHADLHSLRHGGVCV